MPSVAQTALEYLARFERPARLLVECLLVAFVALLIARIAWLVVSPAGAVADYTDRPLPVPMSGAVNSLSVATDRTVLILSNPFDQGEAEIIVQDAPETSLNLHLDGLRMSTEGGAGNAIIRGPNGIGANYSVGDEILAGVTLERILSDRVIINRDGADETLMLGGRQAGLSVISDDSQASPIADAATDVAATAVTPEPDIIERQLIGPEVLLGSLTAQPIEVNGAIEGYRLDPIGDAATMRQAGLEPGDVLRRINGASVESLDMNEVFNRLATAESVELRVNRDGSERTVRLRFGE